jgi:hypothetical protein
MMTKNRHLNALGSRFAMFAASLALLLLIAGRAAAAAPFTDNFDAYTAGTLWGQGSWTINSSPCTVSTTHAESAPNGVTNGSADKSGSAITTGADYISVYWEAGAGATYFRNTAGTWISNIYMTDTQIYDFGGNGGGYNWAGHNLVAGWNRVGWLWDATAKTGQIYVNGSLSPTINYSTRWGGDDISRIGFDGDPHVWFDNISDTASITPPPVAGYNPILTPTAPTRNISNLVDLDNVTMSGNLTIPTGNDWIWDNLIVKFYKQNTLIPARVFSIPLGDLAAGGSFDYSATTTIPYTMAGNNFYKVQYTMTGHKYAGSIANNPNIDWPLLTFDDTWVSDNAGTPPASQITQSILPTQDALEDCGAYSGIDAVVCRLKNFIMGAFLPSNDAINQLNQTMQAFNDKFPMNYIGAISTTFSAIASGVNDAAGITFNLFGNSAAVNTTIFTQDLGSGITLGGTIKLILTFLVLGVFLFWSINYMHRIFT